ncbi:MAG: 50S ribosomal protein L3 [Candidatus Colwellbacteria bacterium]|nr:50S ribosomal protein L3 [Candidatus Colwellbacteria bacterium]
MASYIKAKKLNMTQTFKEDRVFPVTAVEVLEKSDGFELKEGDIVKVTGTSKGKGFQGVVKRHGFHGGPQTHGQKNRLRAPGSIGNTSPQRVLPGRRMAGHMGNVTVTVRGLKVIEINENGKFLKIKGAIPGWKNKIVKIIKQ